MWRLTKKGGDVSQQGSNASVSQAATRVSVGPLCQCLISLRNRCVLRVSAVSATQGLFTRERQRSRAATKHGCASRLVMRSVPSLGSVGSLMRLGTDFMTLRVVMRIVLTTSLTVVCYVEVTHLETQTMTQPGRRLFTILRDA
jgi:hypothetical protein